MHTSAATPQKFFMKKNFMPENFAHHMQVQCPSLHMRIYILRRTKNATQNFQAPQERYNKVFLHKNFWGCGCTCMHSGFLINGYYSTPKGHMTSKPVRATIIIEQQEFCNMINHTKVE